MTILPSGLLWKITILKWQVIKNHHEHFFIAMLNNQRVSAYSTPQKMTSDE
jgi:hypothetical protein